MNTFLAYRLIALSTIFMYPLLNAHQDWYASPAYQQYHKEILTAKTISSEQLARAVYDAVDLIRTPGHDTSALATYLEVLGARIIAFTEQHIAQLPLPQQVEMMRHREQIITELGQLLDKKPTKGTLLVRTGSLIFFCSTVLWACTAGSLAIGTALTTLLGAAGLPLVIAGAVATLSCAGMASGCNWLRSLLDRVRTARYRYNAARAFTSRAVSELRKR